MSFPISNKNFSYYFKNGIGGSLQINFGVSRLGSITTNFTYFSIRSKQPGIMNMSLSFFKGGYSTNFSNSRFFLSCDAGLAMDGSKNIESSKNFIIGASTGYSFKVTNRSVIDIFPAYNQIFGGSNNNMWLTANVLYRVYLNKK